MSTYFLDDLTMQLTEYQINAVTESNSGELLGVLASNQEYFCLCEGEPANTRACAEMITAVPSGFDARNKLFIGFWKDGQPVALMDMLLAYPTKNSIWIGLLLIHGDRQGHGIGRAIDTALGKTAQKNGYTSVQLGVLNENEKALAFWQRLGYRIFRSTAAISQPGRDVYVLVKAIA